MTCDSESKTCLGDFCQMAWGFGSPEFQLFARDKTRSLVKREENLFFFPRKIFLDRVPCFMAGWNTSLGQINSIVQKEIHVSGFVPWL